MQANASIWGKSGAVAGLACLALWLIGCGWGDEAPSPTRPPAVVGIGPAGGRVVADDGMAMITIPAGALDRVVAITVAPATAYPDSAVPRTAYDFGPAGTALALPCTLAIAYDPSELPAATTLAQLRLAEAVEGAWQPLPGFTAYTTAYYLDGPSARLGTFAVTVGQPQPLPGSVAYLVDDPDPAEADQFGDLTAAVAWLDGNVDAGETGTLIWRTSTVQQLAGLAFGFDLAIEVEPGYQPAIAAAGAAQLVINAAGALDLTGFAVTAPAGLVVNADGGLTLAGCDLPAQTRVVLGGVGDKGQGHPGRIAGGSVIADNRGLTLLEVLVESAAGLNGSLDITGNQAGVLDFGGAANLSGDLTVTLAGSSAVPCDRVNIDTRLSDTSDLVVRDFTGATRIEALVYAMGTNTLEFSDLNVQLQQVETRGAGTVNLLVTGCAADSTNILAAAGGTGVQLVDLNSRGGTAVQALQNAGDLAFAVEGGVYAAGLTLHLPQGGSGTISLDHSTHTGGDLVIDAGSGGGPGLKTGSGDLTLTDLNWNGGAADHIDIHGLDGTVAVAGGSFTQTGTAAYLLELTGIGGTVTIQGAHLTGAGVLIDSSRVQLTGNTFSASEVRDDYDDPGLLNDPVQDNTGLLPTQCFTRVDWDGNGCCDYPPAWNVTDAGGHCTVCDGVAPLVKAWR